MYDAHLLLFLPNIAIDCVFVDRASGEVVEIDWTVPADDMDMEVVRIQTCWIERKK